MVVGRPPEDANAIVRRIRLDECRIRDRRRGFRRVKRPEEPRAAALPDDRQPRDALIVYPRCGRIIFRNVDAGVVKVAAVGVNGSDTSGRVDRYLIKIGEITGIDRAGARRWPGAGCAVCADHTLLRRVSHTGMKRVVIRPDNGPALAAVDGRGDIRIPSAREVWPRSSVVGARGIAGIC